MIFLLTPCGIFCVALGRLICKFCTKLCEIPMLISNCFCVPSLAIIVPCIETSKDWENPWERLIPLPKILCSKLVLKKDSKVIVVFVELLPDLLATLEKTSSHIFSISSLICATVPNALSKTAFWKSLKWLPTRLVLEVMLEACPLPSLLIVDCGTLFAWVLIVSFAFFWFTLDWV